MSKYPHKDKSSADCAESRGGTPAHVSRPHPLRESAEGVGALTPALSFSIKRGEYVCARSPITGTHVYRIVSLLSAWVDDARPEDLVSGREDYEYQKPRNVWETERDALRRPSQPLPGKKDLEQASDPIAAEFLAEYGWQVWGQDWKSTTSRDPGRTPSTIHDLDVIKYYIADVANEVAAEYQEILSFEGEDFDLALTAVTDILFAKAKSANPRALEEWLPMSKATIYRRRKRGDMLLQRLGSIDKELQELNHKADLDQLRWIELFRRFGGLKDESPDELEWEPETKP